MAEKDIPVPQPLNEYETTTLQKVFENSPILMCLLEGPDHRVKYANQKLRELSYRGIPYGQPARRVWPELKGQGSNGKTVFEYLDYIFETGESTIVNEIELFYPRKHSDELREGYFNFAYQALTDEQDQVQGILITGQDVTERVKARKARDRMEKRFQLALEGAKLGFFEVDAKGNSFNFLSEQAKKHLGCSPKDEVTYEDFFSAVHPEDIPRIKEVTAKALKEQVLYEVTCRVFWPDGSLHWLLLRGYVITDKEGHPERRIGIAIDITDQKETEEKLKKAIEVRDDFLSIASHELQTPITSIKTRAELFELSLRSEDDEEYAEEIAKISKQVDQLGDLCNNLLDISRISEGKLKLDKECFPMRALLDEVLTMLDPLSGHEFVANYQVEGQVYADRYRMEQVLMNLLNNAMKYSPESAKVVVDLWKEPHEIGVSVTDFGIGISEDEKGKIFRQFYRGNDSGKDTYPGMGVGLFITRAIIERHGGEISVESNPEGGSVFTFKLPARKS